MQTDPELCVWSIEKYQTGHCLQLQKNSLIILAGQIEHTTKLTLLAQCKSLRHGAKTKSTEMKKLDEDLCDK